jgi:YVTN family beta-propeller protein
MSKALFDTHSRPQRVAALVIFFSVMVTGCQEYEGAPVPSDDNLHFPGALQADKDGRTLYVVKTNFDLSESGGAIIPIDLETNQIIKNSGIAIPSFPGILTLRHTDTHSTHGYITSRSTHELTWFEIKRGAEGEPILACGNEAEEGLPDCDEAHRITGDFNDDDGNPLTVGVMPFGAIVLHGGDEVPDRLLTGSLIDGILGVWDLDEDGTPSLIDNVKLLGGLYGMATSSATGMTYVGSQFANAIYALQTLPITQSTGSAYLDLDPEADSPIVAVDLNPIFNAGEVSNRLFGHGIAFNEEGNLGFLAYRNPASVVIFSATLDAFGNPHHEVLGLISMNSTPAEIAVVERADGLGQRVYVSCFGSRRIQVIDTRIMEVVDTIEVGDEPFDIEVVRNPSLGFHRAYVSLFGDHGIAVIDLDESSPTFHDVIATID